MSGFQLTGANVDAPFAQKMTSEPVLENSVCMRFVDFIWPKSFSYSNRSMWSSWPFARTSYIFILVSENFEIVFQRCRKPTNQDVVLKNIGVSRSGSIARTFSNKIPKRLNMQKRKSHRTSAITERCKITLKSEYIRRSH